MWVLLCDWRIRGEGLGAGHVTLLYHSTWGGEDGGKGFLFVWGHA